MSYFGATGTRVFCISGGASSGFRSQSGFCLICIVEAHSLRSASDTIHCQPLDGQHRGAAIFKMMVQ